MEYGLQVDNIKKTYIDFKLNGVSFSVPNGSIMGLIGENGAGKSTTIKLILNLINDEAGEVKFWNNKISKEIREDIGVVFDECNFHDVLNATQISKIMGKIYKNWSKELFNKYLAKFSLPSKKKIKEFSKGMKMKLSIAVALSHDPKLLILDEATSGLDPIVRNQVLDVFLEFIQDEQHSILLSSHITSDLEKIADYITFIHDGRIIFCESKDKLLYEYGIIKCSTKEYNLLDNNDMIASVNDNLEWKVIVKNRERVKQKYNGIVIDRPTIDEMMLVYVKGMENERINS